MAVQNFAGLPVSRWLFALRIWLAIHLALGVAFWLQLDGASSAGVTAAIIALQTRGQILEKALFRVLGTALGGVAAIVIVGLFAQARDLYVLSYSAWLGLCVFTAGCFDGNRAYAAILSGYTVSIVAVNQIDQPGAIFDTFLNRFAAVTIGIASITLVVDLLHGPDIGPGLIEGIGRVREKIRAFTDGLLRDGIRKDTDTQAAALMGAAADQHPLLGALPVEAVSGSARAGAARATLAASVGELRAARAVAVAEHAREASGDLRLQDLVVRRLKGELKARRDASAAALTAAREGQSVPHPPRMPIYRSRTNALRNGLRAFIVSVLTGYLFVLLGWPMTSVSWFLVGVIVCLASTAPDPIAISKAAIVAFPIAIVFGGVTQFLILSGVDQFPLLMIGTAPALFAGLLLMSSPNPAHAPIGMLTTVFTLVIISPSNPQSYDPQTYVLMSMLVLVAAMISFVMLQIILPTTDAHQRRWTLAAARRDMRDALRGRGRNRPEDETRLLDASRIGALVALKDIETSDVATALRMADLARAARRVSHALDGLSGTDPDRSSLTLDRARAARAALAAADANGLRRAATWFADSVQDTDLALAADLAWAADLIDAPASPSPSGSVAASAAA